MDRSDFYPGMVTANGKKVVAADVTADNGIIHIIEDALYPLPQPSFIEMLSNDPMSVRIERYLFLMDSLLSQWKAVLHSLLMFDNSGDNQKKPTFPPPQKIYLYNY